jgi:predicted GIY-YIG superfamily endonuclease
MSTETTSGRPPYGAAANPEADVPEWLAVVDRAPPPAADPELDYPGAKEDLGDSVVYTLHFDPPYAPYPDAPPHKIAGHYTGWTPNLPARLAMHEAGRGARLTQVQLEAGGTWRLAAVEPGTRFRERQLKNHSATRRCPICKAEAEAEVDAGPEADGRAAATTEAEADPAVHAETVPEPEPEPELELEI